MANPVHPSPIVVEELLNDIQRALASTVNDMLAESLRGDDALNRMVEDIQPAVLFHPHMRPYSQLYRKIRDIFVSIGVQVEFKRGYPIVKTLANIYSEGEMRDDALFILSSGRIVTTPQHEPKITSHDTPNYADRVIEP